MLSFLFVTICLYAFSDSLRAVFTQERFTFGDLFLFCVLLWSACLTYAVRVYRMLGETTQGKGGSPAAIPLPLPGFLPQSPAFLLPHPPIWDGQALHVSRMLHKTQGNEIQRLKSWEPSENIRSPKEWGGLWKRERERKPLGGERISISDALAPLSKRLSLAHR